jgi:hypothetical protein
MTTETVNTLSPYLRRVLLADAIVCLASGLLLVLGTPVLAELLTMPSTLLRPVGIFLLGYGALVAFIATRASAPRWAVWIVVIANTLWVVESFVLLLSDWVTPNALGTTFVIAQAVIVAGFALAQTAGLRQPVKVSI